MAGPPIGTSIPPATPADADTRALLDRIREGDDAALEVLVGRYLPLVRRWARGRLPLRARSLANTDDLVQDVLLQAVRHIATLDYRGEEALQAYVRRSVANRIRQEIRRSRRRPHAIEFPADARADVASPLEDAEAHELLERYRGALECLRPLEKDLVVGRIELAGSFAELAATLGLPSDEAARKAFARAVVRLAKEMAAKEVAPGR